MSAIPTQKQLDDRLGLLRASLQGALDQLGVANARQWEQDKSIGAVRIAARSQFAEALQKFTDDVRRLKGAELRARVAALKTIARRAGRMAVVREVLTNLATSSGRDGLLKFI